MRYVVLICFYFSYGYAYEVDQFTNRDVKIQDSTDEIDKEINRRLAKAVEKANSSGPLSFHFKCNGDSEDKKESRLKLFSSIRDELTSSTVVGVIEKYIAKSPKISKRSVQFSDSIYTDAERYSKILKVYETTSVIKINGVEIGSDKLGHFFDQGYSVYLSHYKTQTNAQKYRSSLVDSSEMEKFEYGLRTTGIYSYSDIAANYEGHKFWEKICGNINKDTTKTAADYFKIHSCHSDSYIQCDISTGKWTMNPLKKFTLRDYVNLAWDESTNCNMYSSDATSFIAKQLSRKVHLYKGNPKQPCPVDPKNCLKLNQLYKPSELTFIASPICKKIIAADDDQTKIDPSEKFNYDIEDYWNGKSTQDKSQKPKDDRAKGKR